jgi:hypothetical protein
MRDNLKLERIKLELSVLDKEISALKAEQERIDNEIFALEYEKDGVGILLEALRENIMLKLEQRIEATPDSPITINQNGKS